MSPVGFKPMVPVFERAKTFHVFDRTATVAGIIIIIIIIISFILDPIHYAHCVSTAIGLLGSLKSVINILCPYLIYLCFLEAFFFLIYKLFIRCLRVLLCLADESQLACLIVQAFSSR
jgi:hypothetical protein